MQNIKMSLETWTYILRAGPSGLAINASSTQRHGGANEVPKDQIRYGRQTNATTVKKQCLYQWWIVTKNLAAPYFLSDTKVVGVVSTARSIGHKFFRFAYALMLLQGLTKPLEKAQSLA